MSEEVLSIVTWNINGLRSLCSGRGKEFDIKLLEEKLDQLDSDIICFQETRIPREKMVDELAGIQNYEAYVFF